MKFTLGLLSLFFLVTKINAQVGIGTSTPNQSAILEIKDSTKRILIPRITMSKRLSIVNPAEGLMVYQTDSSKGYWYFDGAQWKSITNSTSNNGGKHTLVLSGEITNAEAQIKIANDFGPNTQEVKIVQCSKLTSVDLSMFKEVTDILIRNNSVLQSINFSNLVNCLGGLMIQNCPLLTTTNFNSLKQIELGNLATGLIVNFTGLKNLNFPLLENVPYIQISNNDSLTSLVFSSLKKVNYLNQNQNSALTIILNKELLNVSFPSLSSVGGYIGIQFKDNNSTFTLPSLVSVINTISIVGVHSIQCPILSNVGFLRFQGDSNLASLNFPALSYFTDSTNNSVISDCKNLTILNFGVINSFKNTGMQLFGNSFLSSQVNKLLSTFVSIPLLTNKYFDFTGQIPPAPPTGQGLIDKSTLITNGNNVITD